RDRDPGLVLLQDPDDLLFREAAAPHVLVLSMGQNELQTGLSQRGNVSCTGNPTRVGSQVAKQDSGEVVGCRGEEQRNKDERDKNNDVGRRSIG
ncbi:hypothetical protein, partial [Phreatobacter sp.]|uniref:hypothetical protein n=1 Tax=Phreatobacter sp. TaxID=1966341 RepID=UPI0026290938